MTPIDPATWKYYHPISRTGGDRRVGDTVCTRTGEVGVITDSHPNSPYSLVTYVVGTTARCTLASNVIVVERRETVWEGYSQRASLFKLHEQCTTQVRSSWHLIAQGKLEEAIAMAEACSQKYKEHTGTLAEPFLSDICQLMAVAHLGLGNYEQAANYARDPLRSYPSGVHAFLYELALQGQGKLSSDRVEKWVANADEELARFNAKHYAENELARIKVNQPARAALGG